MEKQSLNSRTREKCFQKTIHRQVKYLNNIIEADHGKLKRLIQPTLGFKSMKTAYATLKGFEVMHALRKEKPIYGFTGKASRERSV